MKKFLLNILLLTCALPVVAQEQSERVLEANHGLDNSFYAFHVGVNYNWNSKNDRGGALSHLRPSFALSVGKWFSPAAGARVMLGWANNHGGIADLDRGNNWQSFDLGVDGMLSLTNVFFGYEERRFLNLVGYIGFGGIHTTNFSKRDWNEEQEYFSRETCNLLQSRLGLIAQFRLNDRWHLNLEFSHNLIHDSFDGQVTNHRWDRRTTAFVSIVRHLQNKNGSYGFRYARLDPSKFDEATAKINQLRQQEADALSSREKKVVDVNSREMIVFVSFPSGSSQIHNLQEVNVYTIVQSWNQQNRQTPIYIVPVDASSSVQLFRQRAETLRDTLVKRYEIPAEKILVVTDSSQLKSVDESTDRVVVYINESKSLNQSH